MSLPAGAKRRLADEFQIRTELFILGVLGSLSIRRSYLRKPSHRPVYILPNARREVSSGLSLPPCWGRFRVRGVARFILKEVAMPIDSILVSVGVVAMFAILAGALLWGDFQTRSPRKDIN